MFVNGQIDKLDDRLFLFIKVLIAGLGLKVQGVDPKRGSERVAQALNGVVELVGVIFVGHRGAQRSKFTEDATVQFATITVPLSPFLPRTSEELKMPPPLLSPVAFEPVFPCWMVKPEKMT